MHTHAMAIDSERRRFLACLSDPSRFSLVTMLADGPRCVTELATLVGLSQSCTTRHLQALLRERIVDMRREGKRVVYTLRHDDREAHPVLRWACGTASSEAQPAGAPRRTRQRPAAVESPQGSDEGSPVLESMAAHESGWTADDSAPGPPAREVEQRLTPGHADSPRIQRRDMDDFLL